MPGAPCGHRGTSGTPPRPRVPLSVPSAPSSACSSCPPVAQIPPPPCSPSVPHPPALSAPRPPGTQMSPNPRAALGTCSSPWASPCSHPQGITGTPHPHPHPSPCRCPRPCPCPRSPSLSPSPLTADPFAPGMPSVPGFPYEQILMSSVPQFPRIRPRPRRSQLSRQRGGDKATRARGQSHQGERHRDLRGHRRDPASRGSRILHGAPGHPRVPALQWDPLHPGGQMTMRVRGDIATLLSPPAPSLSPHLGAGGAGETGGSCGADGTLGARGA